MASRVSSPYSRLCALVITLLLPAWYPLHISGVGEGVPEGEGGREVPEDLKCPITRELMMDPVVAADGVAYEREAIERWFETSNTPRSPATGVDLPHINLISSINLQRMIEQFLDSNPSHRPPPPPRPPPLPEGVHRWERRIYTGRKKQSGNKGCVDVVGFSLHTPFNRTMWCVDVEMKNESVTVESVGCILSVASSLSGRRYASQGEISKKDLDKARRLRKLEEHFKKNTNQGEARNALRLFENHLVKAAWTRERFESIRKQLEGIESSKRPQDTPAMATIRWTGASRRREWFEVACTRVAAPLALYVGTHRRRGGPGFDGHSFIGPLGTAVGAAYTAALLFHLAHTELDAAKHVRSRNDFLMGFVEGALEVKRERVWRHLLNLPDEDLDGYVDALLRENPTFFADSSETSVNPANPGTQGIDESDNAASDNAASHDFGVILSTIFTASPPSKSPHTPNPKPPSTPKESDPISSTRKNQKKISEAARHIWEFRDSTPSHGSGRMKGTGSSKEGMKSSNSERKRSIIALPVGGRGLGDTSFVVVSNLEIIRKVHQENKRVAEGVFGFTQKVRGTAMRSDPTSASYELGRAAGSKHKGRIGESLSVSEKLRPKSRRRIAAS
ncbi:hypothetical protein AAMO2058_000769400 [Amorphochlora amoebiformis]